MKKNVKEYIAIYDLNKTEPLNMRIDLIWSIL